MIPATANPDDPTPLRRRQRKRFPTHCAGGNFMRRISLFDAFLALFTCFMCAVMVRGCVLFFRDVPRFEREADAIHQVEIRAERLSGK